MSKQEEKIKTITQQIEEVAESSAIIIASGPISGMKTRWGWSFPRASIARNAH